MRLASLLISVAIATPATAQNIELGLPIGCKIGVDCWVQQYVDHDAGPGVKDYACGAETYDGHDGTDFRLQNTQDNASVVASAPGTVKAIRDGMADHLVLNDADRATVKERECGNGVVIDHADGWQTQYCHLRQGSVVVKSGDRVGRNALLGMVGYSGMAAFAHVHLTVRHNGKIVDPFDVQNTDQCGSDLPALWSVEAREELKYAKGDLIGFGFSSTKIELTDVMTGSVTKVGPASDWPALIAYGWAINLEAGDSIGISLNGPENIVARNVVVLDHAKAQYLLFAGKKPMGKPWPKGNYVGRFELSRDAATVISKEWRATLN
jgi:Peptidase family M23